MLRSGHGGEDQADEAEDEQVQARSRLGLQTGAGLPQGNTLVHKLRVCASLPTAAATYDVLFAWMHCAIWCILQAVRHEHTHISTTCCAHKLIMLMKTYRSRKTLKTTQNLHDSDFVN